jgi:cation:H+ antiporter
MFYDLPVKIATGVLLFIFLWRNKTLARHAALILLALYVGYALLRAVFFQVDF